MILNYGNYQFNQAPANILKSLINFVLEMSIDTNIIDLVFMNIYILWYSSLKINISNYYTWNIDNQWKYLIYADISRKIMSTFKERCTDTISD